VGSAHTLILRGPVAVAASVPTRAGQTPEARLVMGLPEGRRLPLDRLLGQLPRTSLAILPGATRAEAYLAGHLFALAGCPTVLLPDRGREPPGFVEVFFDRYGSASAADALGAASRATGNRWLLLGHRGMDPEAARILAEARFFGYVQGAQQALRLNRPTAALFTAEDAVSVARESATFEKYLPDLYGFAREAAYAGGRFESAARYARELVDLLARSRPDSEAHAESLLRLGLVYARLEQYDRAVPALEEAVGMLANLELEEEQAQALASMGVVLENATEYDRALASFESAAALGEELDQEVLLAGQQANIGRLYDLRLSQWARARQSYEQALTLYDGIGDLRGVIQALIEVGRCLRLLGDFPEADRHYRQALELLEEEPDEILQAKVTLEQANNAWFQGRYQEAFDRQREAHRIAREVGWALGQVIALNTSGLTWWTLGDNDRALRELSRALELAQTLEVRDDEVATTLNNIGLVYREMGRYDDALETLNRALAIDQRLKSRWAIAYDLRNLGLTLLRKGEADRAVPLLERAAGEAGAIGDRVNQAKAFSGLGEALLKLGLGAEAEAAFRKALELSRGMAPRETEWRALHGLARRELEREERELARELLIEAVEVIEGMRADIKLEQLRDGFLTNKLAVYEDLVAVLVNLGDPVGAFEVAERSRSRNFIDLLGNQRLTLRGLVDQGLYQRGLTLQVRMGEQEALLAQAQSAAEREAYGAALEGLRDEHRDLLLEMQARNPQLAALVSVAPIQAAEVQAMLEPEAALLAYYLLPDETLCWVLDRDQVTLLRTPVRRDTLGEMVFAYRRLIQNLEPLEGPAGDLHRLLLAPALPAAQGRRYLGIIPHGSLHYLSFATISDGASHLIDDFALFYLPSASVLKYTLKRREAGKNRRVLAVGNPDLGSVALELPFAEQEVDTIGWNFPNITLLTGERATEGWISRHLGDFGIIHLASHGEFDPINPLFSALKLAQDVADDGDLRAAEVFALEINADLVVLSACQTGVGSVSKGDDVIGLNRAFFYAGTHTIISSLWRVSDVATALLMKHFYRRYATRNKAESLRSAILHVKNRYPHPGYWGAFTLAGDYE
jgi:CHAT domain-containing protein/tetratricopeptide (TPR) repeat protein